MRSGGHYDFDIIAWLIANDRSGEIENYLGYFKKYPIDYSEQLFELVHLLEATDNIVPLISLVSATYKQVTTSIKIFGGDDILTPLVAQTISTYLQKDFTDKDIADFMNELAIVIDPVIVDKNDTAIKNWRTIFDTILQPYTCWPVTIPKKQTQLLERYEAIGNNFKRYLHEKTGISWISAWYYSSQITAYFSQNLQFANGKVKKQFDFAEKNIDKIAGILLKNMIRIDFTSSVSLLQAIYHFAAYLQECGNIEGSEKLTIQKDCTKLYNDTFPTLKKDSIEACLSH